MLTSQLVVMPAVTSFFFPLGDMEQELEYLQCQKKSVSWIDWLVFLEWNKFSSKCFILIRCCTVCPIFFSPTLERNLACEFNETRTVICGSLKICCVTISILPNKEGNTDVYWDWFKLHSMSVFLCHTSDELEKLQEPYRTSGCSQLCSGITVW